MSTRAPKSSKPHTQILAWTKTPLDKGIVPLVEALNRIEGVVSVESCECDYEGKATVGLRLFNTDDASYVGSIRSNRSGAHQCGPRIAIWA